jgi:hypothetical protein
VTNARANDFTAIYSDSPNEEVGDDIANILNGNQVVVNFNDLSNRTEYVVGGNADFCAVDAADSPGECSVAGGKPAGGNQNAFAIGWTTGPDAVSASVNQGAGQVRVLMDQRYQEDSDSCAELVNSDGQLFATATSTTEQSSSIPNVVPVTYNFSQNELMQAVGLYIGGAPTVGFGDSFFDDCVSLESPFDGTPDVPSDGADEFSNNVDQVFSIR